MQTIERRHHERELAIRFTRAAVSLGVLALLVAIFSPFFSIIAWSAVICYALYPVHRRLLPMMGGHRTLGALVMCLIITIGVILPVATLSILIGEEVARTYAIVSTSRAEEGSFFHEGWRNVPLVSTAIERLHTYERVTGKNLRSAVSDNLDDLGKFAAQKMMRLATNLLLGVFELGFILVVSFFFFRDGDTLVSQLRELLPFSDERQTLIL